MDNEFEITELTEQEKDRYAKRCGYSEERYADKVRECIKDKNGSLGMVVEDEIAIFRKALAKLLSEFMELKMFVKSEGISDEAITNFIIYNANVEQIKVKAKEDTQ